MSDLLAEPATLTLGGRRHRIASLKALETQGFDLSRLPYVVRVLLENLVRREDGVTVTAEDIAAMAGWSPEGEDRRELAFMPARVLLQDFTGVPAVVDLAAMRDAMKDLGGDPRKINPVQPVELVIDHSVQVDQFGKSTAFRFNAEREMERNRERYAFLRWGQQAFDNFQVVPPDTGIVHQVNLEYLARVVMTEKKGDELWAYPDTLVGTDSHTTMINGIGVLGWGVGGIEAEAALLGQPISMLVPRVVGFRLVGDLPHGTTATDLVLLVTQRLRQHGVVGKFVEFFGPGLEALPLADRATIANMAPEYGATCGFFPVDRQALEYLRFTGRGDEQVSLVEAYMKEQGLFSSPGVPEARYTETLELDLTDVEPSLAGPRRPQDRIFLGDVPRVFRDELPSLAESGTSLEENPLATEPGSHEITHGSVVIAAITSCTNTSNPSVMVAAGLVARNAVKRGLRTKPWVKTSLAPGSKVVTRYLEEAGLMPSLEALGFHLVGYGCTTCIGNSGPLPEAVSRAIEERHLVAASVLSGNRNFEGRISPQVRANFLASPPLVVAYALAGTVNIDLTRESLGQDEAGVPVFLADIWPSPQEIQETVGRAVKAQMFLRAYDGVFVGDESWRQLPVPEGDTYSWDDASTYIKRPPFFESISVEPSPVSDVHGARALAWLGDSVTTDHISPAGAIKTDSPAGKYLEGQGVSPREFNSYGSRRGNHEVMVRGTFANVRLRNLLVPGTEGGVTLFLPTGEEMSIYDASMRYQDDGVPLIVLAGAEYGTGSSRDWAAKGTRLLGVRAVLAKSYERIHRSNLVGMGVLPLEFREGESAQSLGLTGHEEFDVKGLADAMSPGSMIQVLARNDGGQEIAFQARVRLDTPQEVEYYRHGGILSFVLRQLV